MTPHARSRPAGPASSWGSARLLAGVSAGRVDLERHRTLHGTPRRLDAGRLAAELDEVRLLGRGGAAFPVATKLRGTASGARSHVVVNGSEGEPASHKDRILMTLAPHLVLDGALAVAAALGTGQVSVVVQDDQSHASLAAALHERRDTRTVQLRHTRHDFVAGEVRAVTRALSGQPALPPGRRVLPAVHGVHGRPTFASNVETYAHVALLLTLGAKGFASVGAADEPGTTLLTLLGDLTHRGVVEVPTGLPLAALLGQDAGALLVGGYHGTWLDGPRDLVITRPALRAAGAPLNAGVLARLPRDTCALGEVARVGRWLADQSTGQCGPCWFGLPALAANIEALHAGRGAIPDARRRAALLPGRGACAHPDGAATFIVSALDALSSEIRAHHDLGGCGLPVLGVLPTAHPTSPRSFRQAA